jgi:hypothetical protein
MAKYTVRITNDENGINAWIDQDGQKCIMQPNLPGQEGNWATEADALAWANTHAAELENAYETQIAAAKLKAEREEAAHKANLAMVAILERLTNPTA